MTSSQCKVTAALCKHRSRVQHRNTTCGIRKGAHRQNQKTAASSTKSDAMTESLMNNFVLGLLYGSACTVSIDGSTSFAH